MTKKLFSAPFVAFILCGTLVPMGVIAWYGLTDRSGAFTLENVAAMFGGDHARALGLSLALSLISTAICLLLAFPLGLLLRDSGLGKKGFMVFLFILPMWMNFLIRTYAWMTILEGNGLINRFIRLLGGEGFNMINTNGAVVLGMVYNFLPYMILPIYTVLTKIEKSTIEAAQDLGASRLQVFRRILLPMSVPGVISGITMVFVPAVSTFVISKLLGGGKTFLIGDIIENFFLGNTGTVDYNIGAALSLVLMVLILLSMAIMNHFDKDESAGGMM